MALAGIADPAFQIVPAEVPIGLHVSDDRLVGGSAPEFALDDAEYAGPLSRDEDASRLGAHHGCGILYRHRRALSHGP